MKILVTIAEEMLNLDVWKTVYISLNIFLLAAM